jgi:hypothetical protein
LFEFVFNTIKVICDYLEIKTEFIVSSSININHNLKSEEKVLAISKSLNASDYINPIGGEQLYSKDVFARSAINLSFLETNHIPYAQFGNDFVPFLSILDVLMFNDLTAVKSIVENEFKFR